MELPRGLAGLLTSLEMAKKAGLVGRADELALLDAWLREATEGHGALVMVAGEAGGGKTKLLSELAEWARHGGAAVAWGRCQRAHRDRVPAGRPGPGCRRRGAGLPGTGVAGRRCYTRG